MKTPPTGPIVLDYAPAELTQSLSTVGLMRRWQLVCACCFWGALGGVCFSASLALVAAAGAVVAAVLTLVYMGQVARAEAGAGYAARQVVLALLMSPFFLLGVWLVPALVVSDLNRWRLAEERDREPV